MTFWRTDFETTLNETVFKELWHFEEQNLKPPWINPGLGIMSFVRIDYEKTRNLKPKLVITCDKTKFEKVCVYLCCPRHILPIWSYRFWRFWRKPEGLIETGHIFPVFIWFRIDWENFPSLYLVSYRLGTFS